MRAIFGRGAFILSRTTLGLYGIWASITIAAIIRGNWLLIWSPVRIRRLPQPSVES